MSRFPGVDFMDFDSLLTEEERLVRDTVRSFVDERVKPIIEECHRDCRTPIELVPTLGELNLFGASISDYGLPGLGGVAYGLIMQELERGDSGLRSFCSVQSSLVMYPIDAFGSQEQRDRWIPALASGEAIGCFGLTEPDFGSNPGGMRTTARREGNTWVLNGAKQWITNGTLADVAVVWAQTDEGIRGFLVEKGTPGYSAHDQHGKFSLRASTTLRPDASAVAVAMRTAPACSRRAARSLRMASSRRTRPSSRVRRALIPCRIQTSSWASNLSKRAFSRASALRRSSRRRR